MLDGDRLGKAIWKALQAIEDKTMTQDEWVLIATQIVLEIATNGVVLPSSLMSPQGPVTGTGKIQ